MLEHSTTLSLTIGTFLTPFHLSSDCDQEQQLFDHIRDPLLNPNLVKNRDRQQAILKGLSELRQVRFFFQACVFCITEGGLFFFY